MPGDDRDILIAIKTKVDDIHFDMKNPGGRVPTLEKKVDGHAAQINFWRGMIYLLAGLLTLLGTAVVGHILGGK